MSTPRPVPSHPSPELAPRLLYMLLFAVIFWIVTWTLAVTALVQLIVCVLNGRPHAEIARFGSALATYTRQIIEYLTFVSDTLPYPFTAWPAGGSDVPRG